MNGVKAQCRVCNNFALADQFKLHHQYKMMVCPNCYSGKTAVQEQKKKEQEQERKMPPGWDKEDDYLEKIAQQRKKEAKAVFTRISGRDEVKCVCPHCKYSFKYDPVRQSPKTCPYCDVEVPRVKTSSLF